MSLRLELVKLVFAQGRDLSYIRDMVLGLEQLISEGDKAEKPRPTLTAGKTANADAGAKR